MTKAEKQQYVDELVTQLRTIKAAVFTEYHGVSVSQMEGLRNQLFDKGITYKVAKNSLVKRAMEEAGITLDDPTILDLPLALATSEQDEVTIAKALTDANKELEMIVPVAGIVNGNFVPGSMIIALSKLPGREELYAKVVGSLAGLPSRMVRTIANPMTGLVTALQQVKAQKEA